MDLNTSKILSSFQDIRLKKPEIEWEKSVDLKGAIDERYEIKELLGEGGYAFVWEAYDHKAKRSVALKRLKDFDKRESFLVEAQLQANFKHQCIVPVFEIHDQEAIPYFTMEKILGVRLSYLLKYWQSLQKNAKVRDDCQEWPLEIITFVKKITLTQLLEIFEKVLLCVGYLHQRGYAHRDIKSQNIIIDTNMQPYIIDFGLTSALNKYKAVGGTRGYLDPRALDPAPLAKKHQQLDIYALGMILLEIIAYRYVEKEGELRFNPYNMDISKDSLAEFLKKAKKNQIKLPSSQEISSEIYDRKGLCSICQACLGTDNSGKHLALWKQVDASYQRIDLQYQTPEQITIDIQNLLEDRPITARPFSLWNNLAKWSRRNRTILISFFIALWFLLLGVSWFLFSLQKINSKLKVTVGKLNHSNQKLNISLAREKESKKEVIRAQLQEKKAHQKVKKVIYRMSIELAAKYLANNNIAKVDELLAPENCPVALRNWEWQWLKNSSHQELFTLGTHKNLKKGALSFDSNYLASIGGATIKLWDVSNRLPLKTLAFKGGISSCTFTLNGRSLITGNAKGLIQKWDIRTGKLLWTIVHKKNANIKDCILSPNGKYLATVTYSGLAHMKVWDIASKKLHKNFAIYNPKSLYTVDIDFKVISFCCFSPDSKFVAAGGYKKLKIWDIKSGKLLQTIPYSQKVQSSAFSFDNQNIVIGGAKNLQLWSCKKGTLVREFFIKRKLLKKGADHSFISCAFSKDGKKLIAASKDMTLKVWDIASGNLLSILRGHKNMLNWCSITRKNNIISTSNDNQIKLWNMDYQSPTVLKGHSAPVRLCTFSPDGKYILSAGDLTLKLWDAHTGILKKTFLGHMSLVNFVSFSNSGKQIVSASNGNLKIWNIFGKTTHNLNLYGERIINCFFSKNDDKIIFSSYNQKVRVWSFNSKEKPVAIGVSKASFCASDKKGHLLATVHEEICSIWDFEKKQQQRSWKAHNRHIVFCIFSPDGKWLATTSEDMAIKLWEVATGKLIKTFKGHHSLIYHCAFSPDSTRLISGSKDCSLRIWNIKSGECLLTIQNHAKAIRSCAFSPDGKKIITASNDKTILSYLLR